MIIPNLDKPEKILTRMTRISRMKKKISVIREIGVEKILYTVHESH